MTGLTKFCSGDGVNQTAHVVDKTEFSADSSRADGLSPYCKACASARQRAWKKANPKKVRQSKLEYRARQKGQQA